MFCLEELPNELLLIIFSYLKKFELIQSFIYLNQRFDQLLFKYVRHINLSSMLSKNEFNQYLKINSSISSLTIENYQIGNDFLEQFQPISLENVSRIKLVDNGIDLLDQISQRFQPEILNIVITSLNDDEKHYQLFPSSLKRLELEFHIGEKAKKYLIFMLTRKYLSVGSYLFHRFDLLPRWVLVNVRLTFAKLSEYFQVFNCEYFIHIEKVYVSIFAIDENDFHRSTICLPHLIDFQLEICQIQFDLIEFLLPEKKKMNCLERFAFIGQTTNINADSWKFLLNKYNSIERFHLHLSDVKHMDFSDIEQWKEQFPAYSIDYDFSKNILRIHSSKFDRFERLSLNECIENFHHIDYLNRINHLIIRSQYWCSYIDLSSDMQNELLKNFNHVKRLTTTCRQLEDFLQTTFLNQIEQLDLEFSERYCFIQNQIAEQFNRLKSLSLSSIYDGIHDLHLHSTIQDILLKKFPQINYLYIDAIRIIDEEHVEASICQWYSDQFNQPIIHYSPGKSLSIWF